MDRFDSYTVLMEWTLVITERGLKIFDNRWHGQYNDHNFRTQKP
jgi:hypothetical protein